MAGSKRRGRGGRGGSGLSDSSAPGSSAHAFGTRGFGAGGFSAQSSSARGLRAHASSTRAFESGSAWEALEPRALLTAPVVTFFEAAPLLAQPGQTLLLRANATDNTGVRAVSFFRDANGNNRFDAGVDEPLGDVFTRSGSGLFERSVVVGAGWSRSTRLVADAVDVQNNWSGAPLGTTVTVNRPPQVTSLSVIPNTGITPGEAVTVGAVATDDVGVRGVTFFLDRDNNGAWTPGVDTDLGFATGVNQSTGRFERLVVTDASWPLNATIVADATDFDGAWAAQRRSVTIRVGSATPPAMTSFTSTRTQALVGESFTLTVQATDNRAVRAAAFFFDVNANGRWDAGVDQALGTILAPPNVTSATLALVVTSDFAGQYAGRFAVDVVDVDGTWTSTGPRTLDITEARSVQFTSFNVERLGDVAVRILAEGWVPPRAGSNAITNPGTPRFFYDTNGNDRLDIGVDQDLGSAVSAEPGPVGTLYQLITSVSGTWARTGRFVVAMPSDGSNVNNGVAATRLAILRIGANEAPVVVGLTVGWGLTPGGQQTQPVAGSRFRVEATVQAVYQVRTVSVFYDRNNNGLWDSGVDIDLGFTSVNAGVTQTTVVLTGALTQDMENAAGSINVVVQDRSNRGLDEWGPAMSRAVNRVITPPRIGNVTVVGGASVPRNSTVALEFDVADDFGVRTATAFLDATRNGLFDFGLDREGGAATLLSGTDRAGRWRVTIALDAIAPGPYTIFLAGVDYFRGTTDTGGPVNGVWGPRVSTAITIL